jgi:hypothetical protein
MRWLPNGFFAVSINTHFDCVWTPLLRPFSVRAVSYAAAVGGFRGEHGDFDLWVSYDPARGLLTKFSCLVRRAKARSFSGCEARPAIVAPAGSNRSSRGGNEATEAFGVEGPERDLANMQAVT